MKNDNFLNKKSNKLFKRTGVIVSAMLVGVLILSGCQNTTTSNKETSQQVQEDVNESDVETVDMSNWKVPVDYTNGELLSGVHHADIVIKDVGTITVELDADIAPISVTNFMYLAQCGFYKNLTFHRIIDGFMMQGGMPNALSQSVTPIKGEFMANGVENNISHVRGTISMARSQVNNSATSQFFIVHQDSLWLDGQYAGFGHVTSGIEYVDTVCNNTPVIDDNGSVAPDNQPIIEDVIVID